MSGQEAGPRPPESPLTMEQAIEEVPVEDADIIAPLRNR